jgi:hypothetical protein
MTTRVERASHVPMELAVERADFVAMVSYMKLPRREDSVLTAYGGPTYCGSGCISNCDAVAECGQYASPAGKKCPLNTCCSQYGFVRLEHFYNVLE